MINSMTSLSSCGLKTTTMKLMIGFTSSLQLIVVLLFLTVGLQNGSNHIEALISQEEWDIHNVAKRMDIELCIGEIV